MIVINILLALNFFTLGFTADRVWQDFIRGETDKKIKFENKSYFVEVIALTIAMLIIALKAT